MKKECIYVYSLLMAILTLTACSSEQSENAGVKGKTGTFELSLNFKATGPISRGSTFIPATSWNNIEQIQFLLYDASGKIAFSAIETPASGVTSGTSKIYSYATVPADTYTLVALANAQSNTDDVTTYTSGVSQLWSVANVYNRMVGDLTIGHKVGGWGTAITGSPSATAEVAALNPHKQPSEIFMGYATVNISSGALATATVSLTREVSMMRVRVDQTTNANVVGNVDFTDAKASIILYNLPDQMGIGASNAGGIESTSTSANALFVDGGFSTTVAGYLDGSYTSWKDVIVFPNNGGRSNNGNTTGEAVEKYFIVLCGIAQAGHIYAGGTPANVGDPVFWYGQIDEVFTPNVIREVNLLLKTGGLPTPPPTVVEYGGLDVTVNTPEPWDANIVVSDIEM